MTAHVDLRTINGVPHYPVTKWGRTTWEPMDDVIGTVQLGRRHYVDSRTGTALPSVTAIIDMEPKGGGIDFWKKKTVAEEAVASVGYLAQLEPGPAVKYLLARAEDAMSVPSDKGSEFHDFAELMVLGEDVKEADVPERVRPHYRHFVEFLDVAQPVVHSAELIAWDETRGYAGSYDLLAEFRINPEGPDGYPVLDPQGEKFMLSTDYKTGKSVYNSVAKQLTGYAIAEKIYHPDGTEVVSPEVHGGAALHITEAGWSFLPVVLGGSAETAFLNDLRYFNDVEWWAVEQAGVIGKPLAKSRRRRITGTERRS